MTSAYSKSCGYKKFSVHTNTKRYRFQIVPLWRAFSKSFVFVDLFMRISLDGRRIRNNKVAFSNLSGIVWTGPFTTETVKTLFIASKNPRLQNFIFSLTGLQTIYFDVLSSVNNVLRNFSYPLHPPEKKWSVPILHSQQCIQLQY